MGNKENNGKRRSHRNRQELDSVEEESAKGQLINILSFADHDLYYHCSIVLSCGKAAYMICKLMDMTVFQ